MTLVVVSILLLVLNVFWIFQVSLVMGDAINRIDILQKRFDTLLSWLPEEWEQELRDIK